MTLYKVFHGISAIVFLALFIGGSVGAQEYRNPTLALILPYVILMAFGMFGLLIQFVFINLHFMNKPKSE